MNKVLKAEEQKSRGQEDKQETFKNKTSLVKGRGTALAVEGLPSNKKSLLLFPPFLFACVKRVSTARLIRLDRCALCAQAALTRGVNSTLAPCGRGQGEGLTPTTVVKRNSKAAFTLAEVLITLGIIGVVAALTIPALVGNYKKNATVTRVKKFYTVVSQATNLAIAEYGSMKGWDGFSTHHNGPELQHWFDKYLKPQLKIVDEYIYTNEETGNQSLRVIFADGGVMSLTNWAASVSAPNEDTGYDDNHVGDNYNGLIHVAYYTDKKALQKENNKPCVNAFSFLFYSPLKKQYFFQPYTYQSNTPEKYNREYFKAQIAGGNGQYCSALMMFDGWKIKDDYPW